MGFILHGTYGGKSGLARCILDESSIGAFGQWKLTNENSDGCVQGVRKVNNTFNFEKTYHCSNLIFDHYLRIFK